MIMITPLPGATTLKPGSATKPFPGVEAAVYDDQGNELGPGEGGYLVLRRPWPAMLRGIYHDDARYRKTYWSKYPDAYFAGDGARVDEDGDFWLLRPGGRRHERLRAPDLDDRGRVGPRRPPGRRRSRRPAATRRSDHGTRRSSPTSASPRAAERAHSKSSRRCVTMSRRRSGRSRSPRTSSSPPNCQRPAAVRSCVGFSATSPTTGRSGTPLPLADPTVVEEINGNAPPETKARTEPRRSGPRASRLSFTVRAAAGPRHRHRLYGDTGLAPAALVPLVAKRLRGLRSRPQQLRMPPKRSDDAPQALAGLRRKRPTTGWARLRSGTDRRASP